MFENWVTKIKEMAKMMQICAILQLSLIPQIPHLKYRGIAVSIFNTAPRGIAVFTEPYTRPTRPFNLKPQIEITDFTLKIRNWTLNDSWKSL